MPERIVYDEWGDPWIVYDDEDDQPTGIAG